MQYSARSYLVKDFSQFGNYDTAIQSYIALHSVPEPSVLMLLSGAVLLIRRRR